MLRRCLVVVTLLGFSFLVGCGGSSNKVSLSGSVTLKGKPIPDGAVILFEPVEGQGAPARSVTVDGNFKISAANGLAPGMYIVRVSTGNEPAAAPPPDTDKPLGYSGNNIPGGPKTDPNKPVVPPEWNEKSKQQVEVTAAGPNKFELNIK